METVCHTALIPVEEVGEEGGNEQNKYNDASNDGRSEEQSWIVNQMSKSDFSRQKWFLQSVPISSQYILYTLH